MQPARSWSWSPLFNHHLHQRHEYLELELESFYSITTFIRAITSLLQIRQVARLRSTTSNQQEHRNNPVQKPNFRGHAVPAVPKFEPGQGIPPFCPRSASTRLSFQSPLLATPSRLADVHLDPAVLPAPPCLGGSAAVPAIPLGPVASSWTGMSTHAAQTQVGTTRAGGCHSLGESWR